MKQRLRLCRPLLGSLLGSLGGALLALPAAAAQHELAFPLRVLSRDAEQVRLALAPAALARLAELESAVLVGVPLPRGAADLEVKRVDLAARRFGFHLDGAPIDDPTRDVGLSIWTGHVRGAPQDEVALSFSSVGCRGWIRRGSELFHLASGPGPGGDWSSPRIVMTTEAALLAAGAPRPPLCKSSAVNSTSSQGAATPSATSSATPNSPGGPLALWAPLLEARVAIETDYQLNQVFGGNLAAQTTYVATLLTWISYRYEEQVQAVLTYPYVAFYTNANDPWSTPDWGGNSVDMLFEFQGAWANNVPANAHLGAFLSGASLGGGVAWLPGLCNPPYNFSVSGNLGGSVTFPVSVNSGNWDYMVIAHEIGHNFGAPHTHDYCPTPADTCAPNGYYGACQSSNSCTSSGTLMSYCHLCPGGMNNITTYFHPLSVADMRAWAENNCLPLYCPGPSTYCTAKVNSQGCAPSMDATGHPTLSGLDNFTLRAQSVINNKNGLFFWGFAPAAAPFQGGTMCVSAPLVRTGLQNSGGAAGADDCSGAYSFAFTHAYAASRGLTGGTTIYAQCWQRDPASAIPTGLTNALQFTLCN
jgi:hypothetical protein